MISFFYKSPIFVKNVKKIKRLNSILIYNPVNSALLNVDETYQQQKKHLTFKN